MPRKGRPYNRFGTAGHNKHKREKKDSLLKLRYPDRFNVCYICGRKLPPKKKIICNSKTCNFRHRHRGVRMKKKLTQYRLLRRYFREAQEKVKKNFEIHCHLCGKTYRPNHKNSFLCDDCGNKSATQKRFYKIWRFQILSRKRRYYKANREARIEAAKKYYRDNRERILERDRKRKEFLKERLKLIYERFDLRNSQR